MRIPQEIENRLFDAGYMSRDTIPVTRAVEECEYVLQLLAEGGTTYDEDTPAERAALRKECNQFIRTMKK